MTTITATNARKDLFNVLWEVIKGFKHYKIKYKNDNVVLMSECDYEELVETIELLSEPKFKFKLLKEEKEIEKWEIFDYEDVFN